MSEQKCPNCEALIERAPDRCPVCEETLSAPIKFERRSDVLDHNDSFRLRWQRNNTPENKTLIGPWNGDATDEDLRAAGYVRVPTVGELSVILGETTNIETALLRHVSMAIRKALGVTDGG